LIEKAAIAAQEVVIFGANDDRTGISDVLAVIRG